MLKEPLSPDVATRLIHAIAKEGDVAPTSHAERELAADGMTMLDCQNVMRCGAVMQPPDFIKDSWRYRIETKKMCVVIAFRSETELTVVTAWRHRR